MKPTYSNIPEELRALPNWVVWRQEKRANRSGVVRETKVAYNPISGKHAKTNAPGIWASFNDAAEALEHGYAGMGFCLTGPLM